MDAISSPPPHSIFFCAFHALAVDDGDGRTGFSLLSGDRFFRPVDLLAEGLDVAVRIGESADESLVARRLHALRVITFGTPSYFSEYGRPEHQQHRTLLGSQRHNISNVGALQDAIGHEIVGGLKTN